MTEEVSPHRHKRVRAQLVCESSRALLSRDAPPPGFVSISKCLAKYCKHNAAPRLPQVLFPFGMKHLKHWSTSHKHCAIHIYIYIYTHTYVYTYIHMCVYIYI